MSDQPWATPDEIAAPWRPLSAAEKGRAAALIASVQRDITRRWPTVPARLARNDLARLDVADVITYMVLPILGGPPFPGARSWQVTSGSESRSVTLDASGNPRDPWTYAPWMVDILAGAAIEQATAQGSFPQAQPYDRLFPDWPERY